MFRFCGLPACLGFHFRQMLLMDTEVYINASCAVYWIAIVFGAVIPLSAFKLVLISQCIDR